MKLSSSMNNYTCSNITNKTLVRIIQLISIFNYSIWYNWTYSYTNKGIFITILEQSDVFYNGELLGPNVEFNPNR